MDDVPRTFGINNTKKSMGIDELNMFAEQLKSMKVKRTGFIMIPEFEGFKMYEIDEDRLKKYLAMEILHKKAQEIENKNKCCGRCIDGLDVCIHHDSE